MSALSFFTPRPRGVERGQRHKWDRPASRQHVATCERCGAKKRVQLSSFTGYAAPGSDIFRQQRPPCRAPDLE